MRRYPAVAFRLACLGLAAAACVTGCSRSPQKGPDPKTATIRVGYVGHDHQLALYVAALAGESYREPAGVWLRPVSDREVYDLVDGDDPIARLRMVKVGGASNMPAAMVRGDIQLGLGGLAPVSKFVDKGQPLKVIAPLQTDGDMLVMRTDSPVGTWEQFVAAARQGERPLRIGYKGPTAVAKMVFLGALEAEGLAYTHDPADRDAQVLMVHMVSQAGAIPMLSGASGEEAIDGLVINQPVAAQAELKGVGKTIAHLRDLPPAGAWENHPCCIVAATEAVLAEHPQAVEAFLRLLIMATRDIQADPSKAVEAAVAWGGDRQVEQRSIPTVTYLANPDGQWLGSVVRWVGMMQEMDAYQGRLAGIEPDQATERVLDLSHCRAAWDRLRREGRLD